MKLLFDDDAIDRTAGVRRVLGSPKKEPDPILEPQMPWETAKIENRHLKVGLQFACGKCQQVYEVTGTNWECIPIDGPDHPSR